MKVILLEDIDKLGKRGAIVSVKDGYGRNFLLPRKLAMPATDGNMKRVEMEAKKYKVKEAKEEADATQMKSDLEQLALQLLQLVGDEVALFRRCVLELALAEGGLLHLDHLDAIEHDLAGAALVALALHDLLQLVARAADGEALVVEQVADAPDHQHLVVLVVAPVAAPLHGPNLRELLLPIP